MLEHRLPEQLDIRRIDDAHRYVSAALSESPAGPLEFDASGVSRIDTAGVQLLAAALSGEGGARIALRDPAPCIVEAFAALGLNLGSQPMGLNLGSR